MANDRETVRIIFAFTDSRSIAELWRAAVGAAQGIEAELVAVYLDDERWYRAASLPFTREFPKIGGGSADFTRQRAEELIIETVSKIRSEINRLATESGQTIAFETLAESDHERIQLFVGKGKRLLIAPSTLARHPIYAELTRLEVDIRLVGAEALQ